MRNLVIVFERTVNRGFPDEPDKMLVDKKTGEKKLHKGTRGEHVQEWHCAMTDQRGWPIAGLSASYFAKKISEGYKPIDILGEGKPSPSWTEDMRNRLLEALDYVRPMVLASKQIKSYEQQSEKTDGLRQAKSPRIAEGASA